LLCARHRCDSAHKYRLYHTAFCADGARITYASREFPAGTAGRIPAYELPAGRGPAYTA